MVFSASYDVFVIYARKAVLGLGILVALIAFVDWNVRTRRISPFSRIARFFRFRIDPLLAPIERLIVQRGGVPSAAAFWGVVVYMIAGVAFLWLLSFIGSAIQSVSLMSQEPLTDAWRRPVRWLFGFLQIALMVRVISTWLPISPYSRWIRWSYVTTEWMIRPLRRVIPPLGMIDISPLVAWFGLMLIESLIVS